MAAVVSCSEDNDYSWGTSPQQNEQAAVITFGNGSVSPVSTIDFANITAEQEYVKVCEIVSPTASDASYNQVKYELVLGNEVFPLTENGEIKVADLQKYLEDNYGKAPTEREVTAVVRQWIANGTTSVNTATSAEFPVKAKLAAPHISEHYYIIGAPSAWDPSSTALPFKHSSTNVYDDPIFTVTFSTDCKDANGDIWFAIVDDECVAAATDWSLVLGAKEGNGNNLIGEPGFIARRTEIGNDGSFKISVGDKEKVIKVTLNMMEGTYLIEPLSFNEYVGVIGNHNGWKADEPIASPNYDGAYQGYMYLDGGFKIRQNGSWADTDTWGGGASDGELTQPGSDITTAAGFYQVNADLFANTYSLVPVTSITCVGNHNGWNQADANCHLAYNVAEKCWEGTFNLTNGFKFAMNDDWAISWGGANGNPDSYDLLTEFGGKDLNVPAGDGQYEIKLYLSCEGKHKVVLTKK